MHYNNKGILMRYFVLLLILTLGIPLNAKDNDKGLKKIVILENKERSQYEYFRNGKKILEILICKRKDEGKFDVLQIIFYNDEPFIGFYDFEQSYDISIHHLVVTGHYPEIVFTKQKGKIHEIKIYDKNLNVHEFFNFNDGLLKPVSDIKLKKLREKIVNAEKNYEKDAEAFIKKLQQPLTIKQSKSNNPQKSKQ